MYKNIGVLTVATNIYIDYWHTMAKSLISKLDDPQSVVFHVYTDNIKLAKNYADELAPAQICIHETAPYKWPEATLLRYEIFSKDSSCLQQDLLMHMDADMLVHQDFFQILQTQDLRNGIGLVNHPGYWNPVKTNLLLGFWKLRGKPLGSWETNRNSAAYVAKEARKTYFCGGVWFGRKKEFIDLLKSLSKAVRADLNNGIIAIWHDESHLNCWAAANQFTELLPSFCYVRGYRNLINIPMYIEAVEKGELRTR